MAEAESRPSGASASGRAVHATSADPALLHSPDGGPVTRTPWGSRTRPSVLIEYSDFQCLLTSSPTRDQAGTAA
ncbi:hypothetical protein LV779_08985 [Streptomyces thinghirensis]|nr:hypothetical protein [Streptomyces thinghirensis]